jgi:DNA-binding transcriptional regulator LsrR (DeoR family)
MQLYLELKFLYKNLILSTQTSSSENFCIELILAIKEYYNLEEVIVVDSIHMEFKTRTISLLKKEIYNFVQCNLYTLKEKFKTKDVVVLNTKINNKKYILYIAELARGIDCDGFIICVENFPSLLSKNELLGLESNINLLKTRLFYD